MEVLKTLSLIFVVFVVINIVLSWAMFRSTKENLYKKLSLFWLLALLNLFCAAGLQSGHFLITLGLMSAYPSVSILAEIVHDITKKKTPHRFYGAFYAIALILAGVFSMADLSFFIISAPAALIGALPLFHCAYIISTNNPQNKLLYKVLAFILLIDGLHVLDFPILRTDPSIQIFAFSFHFIVIQSLSLIFPSLAMDQYHENKESELVELVDLRTRDLQKTLNLKNVTYQVLVHDFSNFIFALRSIMKRIDTKDEDNLEKSHFILDKMSGLISEVRNLESFLQNKDHIELSYYKIDEIYNNLHKSFEEQLSKKHITLLRPGPSELKIAVLEPFFSVSILGNYLSNAIKFSENFSNISIKHYIEKKSLIIELQDHGIGIDEENLQRIQEASPPTVKYGTKKEKGTGLGTMIAHTYLRLQELEVAISSMSKGPETGTKVKIILPANRFH